MRHERIWEYLEWGCTDFWRPTTAEELLFELIPTGKAQAYRLNIIILDEPREEKKK